VSGVHHVCVKRGASIKGSRVLTMSVGAAVIRQGCDRMSHQNSSKTVAQEEIEQSFPAGCAATRSHVGKLGKWT
jgi:hypothetical protein